MNDPTPAQDRTHSPSDADPAHVDVGTADGAREARYAEAMRKAAKAHTLTGMSAWDCVCACGGWPVFGESDVQHSDHVADAVAKAIAPLVAAEVAAAVSEAQAEVEGLLEGIRALADYWDGLAPGDQHYANRLRALLAPSPAATTGEAVCPTCGKTKSDRTPGPHAEGWGLCPESFHFAPVSSGEAGTGEAGSQWEQMLRDPNEQFDVNGEVAQVILDATGHKPNRLLGGPYAGIQHEAWQAGECGSTIEEPVQITTASAKPSKPTTWIADLCGLPKGHDGDCVKRGDLPAPVVTPSAEGSE